MANNILVEFMGGYLLLYDTWCYIYISRIFYSALAIIRYVIQTLYKNEGMRYENTAIIKSDQTGGRPLQYD